MYGTRRALKAHFVETVLIHVYEIVVLCRLFCCYYLAEQNSFIVDNYVPGVLDL